MKFIIADNQAIYREGLARVIAREPEWTIVALCTEPESFQRLLPRFKGAVALFSASLAAVYERAQEAEARCIAILENGQHPTPFKAAGVHGAFVIAHRALALAAEDSLLSIKAGAA